MLERDYTTFREPDFQVLWRILLLENDSKCDSLASLNSIAWRSECPIDKCQHSCITRGIKCVNQALQRECCVHN